MTTDRSPDLAAAGGAPANGGDSARPSNARQAEGRTIAADLQRTQLHHRARQLDGVLELLNKRIKAADTSLTERRGLQHALADFSHERNDIRRRLNTEQPDTPSTEQTTQTPTRRSA